MTNFSKIFVQLSLWLWLVFLLRYVFFNFNHSLRFDKVSSAKSCSGASRLIQHRHWILSWRHLKIFYHRYFALFYNFNFIVLNNFSSFLFSGLIILANLIIVESNCPETCFFFNLSQILFREKTAHGHLSTSHKLNPSNDFEFLFRFCFGGVNQFISAIIATFERDQSLQAQFNTSKETNWNSFPYLFIVFTCLRVHSLRFPFFTILAFLHQNCMVADIAYRSLVLKYRNRSCK